MNGNNRISDDKINEIRASVDIVDVISSYIPLTPKGKNFFGVCPFHDDHSPSMSVDKTRQIFKCFSCGAGGNVFTFVKDYENISFLEAVKKMADKAGIFLDVKVASEEVKPYLKKYYEMYDLASKLYSNNINTKEGLEAKKYLAARKIDESIIKKFGIGLALKNNHLLTQLLIKKGYQENDIQKIGLASGDDKLHDIYYNRIMFPLYDLKGQVVGFSGRIYNNEDTSKYINTKETEIFKKGEILYHYHIAKNIARSKNQVIVVEGFMDVIRLSTIGIENVVATMGTAVTKEQIHLIKKMAKEIILMFDGDDAGQKAIYQAGNMLIDAGINPKVVVLEDNLDPDEYILKYGSDAMEYKLTHPRNMMDFKLEYLKRDKDISSTQDKAVYIKEMIAELNKMTDPILREATILKICEDTDFNPDFIRAELKEIEEQKEVPKEQPIKKKEPKRNRYIESERRLIFYMLNHEDVIKIYQKKVKFLNTEKYRLLAKEINYFYQDNGYISEADIISYLRDQKELSETLQEIMALPLKEEYTKEEIKDYVEAIQCYKIESQIERLKKEQKKATDQRKKVEIAEEIVRLKKELVNVDEGGF